jgi:hypothetical protein
VVRFTPPAILDDAETDWLRDAVSTAANTIMRRHARAS